MQRDWLGLIADPGSVRPLEGEDESVAAAWIHVDGRRAMFVWNRFEVSAGTLSIAAGERLVQAFDAAIAEGVGVVALTNSGGARMQEGTGAFVQMIAAARAARRVRDAGLPLVVYLANPTTGGVFASWGSLGTVTWAEPEATIGFTGPRVARALGEPIEPAETQTAEGLLANGLVDAVVSPGALRGELANLLGALRAPETPGTDAPRVPDEVADGPHGWAAVAASRREGRRDVVAELLDRATNVVELRGDRGGAVDDAVLCAIVRVDGRALMVIGHRTPGARPRAAGLRTARRAMGLAEELRIPVMAIVDTAGAVIGGDQEREGFAGEIAKSLDALSRLAVPTVTVIAGQGSGGAAMAWLAADEVVAAPDSWIAPISPEAASLIVHRDTDHAPEMADMQRIGATELREQGIVSRVVATRDLLDAALASVARD